MRITLFCLLFVCGQAIAKENTLLVPGKSLGPITARSTRADLDKLFGAANVKNAPIPQGEGETVPGAVVYDKDPKRRLEITWTQSKLVGDIRFGGHSSVWHTAEGITLGTTLADLQKLNGKAFKFSGFDWDYGGQIQSWEGGKLATSLAGCHLTLNGAGYGNDVSGDREFLSSNVLKKKYKISVGQIRIVLNRD